MMVIIDDDNGRGCVDMMFVRIFSMYVSRVTLEPIGDAEGA